MQSREKLAAILEAAGDPSKPKAPPPDAARDDPKAPDLSPGDLAEPLERERNEQQQQTSSGTDEIEIARERELRP
jgi:hypothetical protein